MIWGVTIYTVYKNHIILGEKFKGMVKEYKVNKKKNEINYIYKKIYILLILFNFNYLNYLLIKYLVEDRLM